MLRFQCSGLSVVTAKTDGAKLMTRDGGLNRVAWKAVPLTDACSFNTFERVRFAGHAQPLDAFHVELALAVFYLFGVEKGAGTDAAKNELDEVRFHE